MHLVSWERGEKSARRGRIQTRTVHEVDEIPVDELDVAQLRIGQKQFVEGVPIGRYNAELQLAMRPSPRGIKVMHRRVYTICRKKDYWGT